MGINVPRSRDHVPQPKGGRQLGRKEQRKADRQHKKGRVIDHRRQASQRPKINGNYDLLESEPPSKKLKRSLDVQEPKPTTTPAPTRPKSILKKPTVRQPSSDLEEGSDGALGSASSSSLGLALDKTSRSYKEQLARDDAEIAALEKKLGIKGKKLPKSFDDDLAFLLDGLDDIDGESEERKRKREGDEWLQNKRKRAQATPRVAEEEIMKDGSDHDTDDAGSESQSDGSRSDGESEDNLNGLGDGDLLEDLDDSDGEISEGDESFDGFGSEDDDVEAVKEPKKRENPYVAPVTSEKQATTARYIPPSMRKSSGPENESLQRLRRQLQGQINKLSEANILSIVGEIEKLYQTNPRQDVTTTVIDLLLGAFSDRSQLQNTFVILHATFISAIYKVVGTDFGAEVVARLVSQLDKYHTSDTESHSKEQVNLISLMSYLYTFHVIGTALLFDYIRLFLTTVSESNTELLLRIIRDCGPQLRQDDPATLKDIVLVMQGTLAEATKENRPVSVRTKFMVETITDLKNNKIRSGAAGTAVAAEHITRMRKALGSLNNSRTIKASEPLRIGLQDIRNSDKRGKWWLVGASWKEVDTPADSQVTADESLDVVIEDEGETDFLALAQQHRMNTSVRRSIFIAIMSASDYKDAHLRLMKLRLKKSQELEIPRVLLHCSGGEETYNPYYTLISKQLCSDNRKMRMSFQFALWNFFKRLGERPDEEEDEENVESVEMKEIVNLGKMFAHLIIDGIVTIGVLKVLNLSYLKEQAKLFVEVLLITIITRSHAKSGPDHDETPLANVFLRAGESASLIQGLKYFVKKVLRKSDLVTSKKETRMVHWACGAIDDILSSAEKGPIDLGEADSEDDFDID